MSIAYAGWKRTVAVYGGYNSTLGTLYNDTWELNTISGSWTRMAGWNPPPTREGAVFVYDSGGTGNFGGCFIGGSGDLVIGGLNPTLGAMFSDSFVWSNELC